MLPTGVAAFVALSALIPAWYYERRTESSRPRSSRSSLTEVLELLAVAAVTTGPPALAAALAPESWRKNVFDPADWFINGTPYLAEHLRGAAVQLALILICAMLIAEGLAWLTRKGVPDEFHPSGAVWSRALAERPKGTYPWVGVMLADGTLVEGVLKTIDLSSTGDDRDLALTAPIRVTPTDGVAQRHPHLDRLVVPAREIRWISAMHLPEKV
ncbi:DUF6338 family protein [Aeromicrobium piscarium]|uniref:Uncharacterized protein n=1 Tax=Aeromicrobium piscarium TaxID=2590901 RepID=A0A554RN24_9ACTN|nr:DUF6338 family protein [Aeromicrobium piscarium]TSD55547.1 hypothetical protein FNM00_16680 [Aeromicrobium piscarium]